MFCLSRCEPLGPALCPIGAMPLPDGGVQCMPNKTSQSHGTLTSPRPLCCWSIQSHPSPFTQSATTGLFEAWQTASRGPPLPSAQVELACSLWFRGCGMQRYQVSSQRGFKCSQCVSPGHQQGEQRWKQAQQLEAATRLLNGKSQAWKGISNPTSHTTCTWISTCKQLQLTPGPQFQTIPFPQGNDTPYNAVTTWSTHCIPQGLPVKIRAGLDFSFSLRVLRFAGPSLGLSGLKKGKLSHRSPYQNSYKWDVDDFQREGEPESASSNVI